MARYKVTFLPEHKEVEVDEGVSLLEAVENAGVYINSLCGGEGLCGQCRLQVVSGNARADKHAIGFFSKEEIVSGYVLACQTRVEDNLEVLVPAKSRLEMEKIVIGEVPITYCEPGKVSLHRRPCDPASLFEPLVTKVYMQLPQPSIDDNISDIDRITRELGKRLNYSSYEISLSCLQDLASKLRQSGWSQTSVTDLIEKQNQLLQTISFLEEGLNNHFGFEEEALPPLFGELLMKAILYEHHEISGQIESAKTTLSNIKLEGLEQRELLSQKSEVQRIINRLCQAVEEHAQHEETILNMMKKSLEENTA